MKKAISVVQSLWFLMIIFLIIVGGGLNVIVHGALILIALLVPLVRELAAKRDLDERQIQISHYSSHIAYFVYSLLLVLIIVQELLQPELTTLLIFSGLLLVPLLFKIGFSFFQRYGPVKGFSGYLHVLLRGILPPTKVDERQIAIGNLSSHIAFYVFLSLTISVMFIKFIRMHQEPPTLWYMLLMVPLIAKLMISFFMSYGAVRGAQFIGSIIVLMIFIFILLSHGLTRVTLFEAIPFVIILALMGLSKKFPRIAGLMLIFLAVGLAGFLYIRVWSRFDIYHCILMFSLIPIPVLVSGMALLTHQRFKI
ncbi:hypothetical protein L0128_19490 [candidate division KSB1 bacterium]|nr:hypothetical protein [candidate division KSB1 bacterium]